MPKEKEREEGRKEGCLESIQMGGGWSGGGGQETPGGPGAESCGMGWNAFQGPSRCPLRAAVLPEAAVWGGADCSQPTERCLISSLVKGPGCGQTGMEQCQPILRLGAEGRQARGSLSHLCGTVTSSPHPSGTPLSSEP